MITNSNRTNTDAIIRLFTEGDTGAIVTLSLLAWEPVFQSFRNIFGPTLYDLLHPDWRKSQAEGVENICKDEEKYTTLVAEVAGEVVGFLSYELRPQEKRGEVMLLAVHPDYQNAGIGTDLNLVALDSFKTSGMEIAIVETGGDESHAPARRSYEKAGYTPFPIVRYFKAL